VVGHVEGGAEDGHDGVADVLVEVPSYLKMMSVIRDR
jgi:hypothetical protein